MPLIILLYCTSYGLNMFRALLCPSSGACDYDVDYHIGRFVLGLLYVGAANQERNHQELATMMLITTLVVSFLVCCMLEQQTKNEMTNVVINIIVASS